MSININLYQGSVYNPESDLEGTVVAVLNANKNIRGIRLKLVGREHTSWEDRESYYDSQEKKTKWRTVHYSGDNKFLEIIQTLQGEGMIHHGRHEFPFRFILPRKLPSSYNGSHGNIQYYLKANVDIPMALDYNTERHFTVKSLINFNNSSGNIILNPTQYQDETNLCCCCCASDPITAEAYFDKEAFVLGEMIRIKLHVTNMSNTSIELVRVELKRTTTEKCTVPKSDEKNESDVILSDSETGVGAHGDRDFNFKLQIPRDFDLPNFTGCKLFSQKFRVKIEVVIPGCHSNMEIIIPIKLGHIGVGGQENIQNAQMQGTYNTSVPPYPVAPPSYPPGGAAPPYPTGPNAFPVPPNNPGNIGFAVPNIPPPFPGNSALPAVHQTKGFQSPYPPGPTGQPGGSSAPYPTANAPSDPSAPSAPSKAELAAADNDDFILLDDPDGHGPPPPSYQDAMKK